MKLPNFGKPKHPVIFILSGVVAFVTAAAIISTIFGALGAYDAQKKATSPKAKASASASARAQVNTFIETQLGPFSPADGDDINPSDVTKAPLLMIATKGGFMASETTNIPLAGPGIDYLWGSAYESKLPGSPITITITVDKVVALYGKHFATDKLVEIQFNRPFILEEYPDKIYKISPKGLIRSMKTTDALSIKKLIA